MSPARLQSTARQMAGQMLIKYPEMSERKIFEISLGWFQWSKKNALTDSEKKTFLDDYAAEHKRLLSK